MTARPDAVFRPMEDRDRQAVLALSRAWAEENITYGYFAGGDKEVGGEVAGYAAGQMETAFRDSSIQRTGDQWFELEELYVDQSHRSCGLGGRLLDYVEGQLRGQGPLLRFYLCRGMTLYSVRAFRDL